MSEEAVESFLLFDLADCELLQHDKLLPYCLISPPYNCLIFLPSHCVLLPIFVH